MKSLRSPIVKALAATTILTPIICAPSVGAPPIVQPGAPGAATRDLTAEDATKLAENSHSPDDVLFLQEMIPHHFQAVEMSNLVEERTNNKDVVAAASRIKATQTDEITFMQDWLSTRGYKAADPAKSMAQHGGHKGHDSADGHANMSMARMKAMGMATPDQMKELAAAEALEFDKLFLTLMARHHQGAVTMVEDLEGKRGSLFDPQLFAFVNDISNEQTAEIERMDAMFTALSSDPRADLSAGLEDAGEAIKNITLVAHLPRPDGFFDPANPNGLQPKETESSEEDGETRDSSDTRAPFLSFSNTDMAFFGDKMVAGNYHGFNIYQLTDKSPELLSSVVCPGGQGDVSVVGDILIMSVEETRGRVDCGLGGIQEDVSSDRFMGIRIFDISDVARPRQVGQVQTCRGSHTHSVVSSDQKRIVVYNSGTSRVRDGEELSGCIGEVPGDERTALFSIDVIEIPLADPSKSRIVDSPRVFADKSKGTIAGLWEGGDHGDGTQRTRRTDQCHDITVFPAKNLAAGACSGNGIIFDISNPLKPKRIDAVTDQGFAYWHSATFNNDGTKVLFTDEWGGGGRPRCRASDPLDWGADAIYDIADGKLSFKSYFKIEVPQSDTENCVAHNGAVVPVPGRDIFVQAWYQGGMSIIDFTDSEAPKEIGFFDRGPIDDERLALAGYWSTYYYDGKIYGTEIIRGLDVFELEPSDQLSENEIAAAALADVGGTFNPQQQFSISWPAVPVVAHAYLDQFERDNGVSGTNTKRVRDLLADCETAIEQGAPNTKLAEDLTAAAKDMGVFEQADQSRAAALKKTLIDLAKSIG